MICPYSYLILSLSSSSRYPLRQRTPFHISRHHRHHHCRCRRPRRRQTTLTRATLSSHLYRLFSAQVTGCCYLSKLLLFCSNSDPFTPLLPLILTHIRPALDNKSTTFHDDYNARKDWFGFVYSLNKHSRPIRHFALSHAPSLRTELFKFPTSDPIRRLTSRIPSLSPLSFHHWCVQAFSLDCEQEKVLKQAIAQRITPLPLKRTRNTGRRDPPRNILPSYESLLRRPYLIGE